MMDLYAGFLGVVPCEEQLQTCVWGCGQKWLSPEEGKPTAKNIDEYHACVAACPKCPQVEVPIPANQQPPPPPAPKPPPPPPSNPVPKPTPSLETKASVWPVVVLAVIGIGVVAVVAR